MKRRHMLPLAGLLAISIGPCFSAVEAANDAGTELLYVDVACPFGGVAAELVVEGTVGNPSPFAFLGDVTGYGPCDERIAAVRSRAAQLGCTSTESEVVCRGSRDEQVKRVALFGHALWDFDRQAVGRQRTHRSRAASGPLETAFVSYSISTAPPLRSLFIDGTGGIGQLPVGGRLEAGAPSHGIDPIPLLEEKAGDLGCEITPHGFVCLAARDALVRGVADFASIFLTGVDYGGDRRQPVAKPDGGREVAVISVLRRFAPIPPYGMTLSVHATPGVGRIELERHGVESPDDLAIAITSRAGTYGCTTTASQAVCVGSRARLIGLIAELGDVFFEVD